MPQPLQFDGPRLLRPEERLASQQLFAAVFGGPGEDVTGDFSRDELPGSETCVFAHEGKLVSQIGTFAETLVVDGGHVRVGSIGGVGTLPEYRGHGLATQLMEFCAARLRQSGTHILFISGARGLYTRLGNVPAGAFHRFVLRPADAGQRQSQQGLRLADETDSAACSRLYDGEIAHFRRSPAAFAECFRSRKIGFQAEKWVIERGGAAQAYIILNTPWDYIDQPQAGIRSTFEYAGDRSLLAGALLDLAANHGLNELEITVPWQDDALADQMRAACPAAETGAVPLPDHTLRIIDLVGMMESLQPLVSARLGWQAARDLRFEQSGPLLGGSGGDRHAAVLGDERLELDGAAMSRLVFGDASGQEVLPGLPHSPQRAALRQIFPLPSFFAGLNFH